MCTHDLPSIVSIIGGGLLLGTEVWGHWSLELPSEDLQNDL